MPRVKKQTAVSKQQSAKAVSGKRKTNSLSIPVYSLTGKETGQMALPKEYFGQKVNKTLLTQALRVYMTNQKNFTSSSKTRAEVQGTTKKAYSQKGTGRARHGARTAPIFIGGGIVFGPRPRTVRLDLPKKMKKAALIAALSAKAADGKVLAVSGLEKASGKTKEIAQILQKINVKSALLLTGEKMDNVVRAVRNIKKVDVLPVNLTNAFEVIKHHTLMVTKESIEKLSKAGKEQDLVRTGQSGKATK